MAQSCGLTLSKDAAFLMWIFPHRFVSLVSNLYGVWSFKFWANEGGNQLISKSFVKDPHTEYL